jgi:FKBP-type peptidyl-prolyl cis-trans isomerase SlyD
MEKGDMVLVSYTGKDVANGKVFETTDAETAKEAGFWRENAVFSPVPVIIGNNDLLKALEEELIKMKEGEQRTVKLSPEQAFGQRRKELSGVLPMQEFKRRNITPARGMIIDVNGRYGRVQSISGGRIRVDFNSDLAGKEIEYKIKIDRALKTNSEKVEALADKFFPIKDKKAKTKITGSELEITLPSGLPPEIQQVKQLFNATITKNIKGIEKVKFVEEFEKPKEEKEAREAKQGGKEPAKKVENKSKK